MEIYSFIDGLIQEGRVAEAVKMAYTAFYQKKDVRSFTVLANALVTARRISELEDLYLKYPHFFRERKDTLAVMLFRGMRLRELFSILPEVPGRARVWILASLGYVEEAEQEWGRLEDRSKFLRIYLDILTGKRPDRVEPLGESVMSKLYADYLRGIFLVTAGTVGEGLELLNSVAYRSFRGGYVGWGIDTLLLKGFLGLNPTDLEAARYIAEQLGDRFSVELSKLYMSLFRCKVPEVPDVPRFSQQKSFAEAVLRGDPIPRRGTFGYRSQWWYVDKFHHGRRFLTLAGKARVMEGRREVHLPRPNRSIPVLVFHRLLGSEGKEYAHLIFQKSKDPRRRYEEYLGRLGELKHIPMDHFITGRYGTFLSEETEPWAVFLKERFSK